MLLRKAMLIKRERPELKLTKQWWMKHFLQVKGTSLNPRQPVPTVKVNTRAVTKPTFDWSTMNKKQVMEALVEISKRRIVPKATTRFNILPQDNHTLAVPRSVLLGAFTVRGTGINHGYNGK